MRLKFILICLLFIIKVNGQTELPDVNNLGLVPKSPEATAFIKYGNVNTNLYTGTPNISIPIYTIKGKEITFPITLSYDASGIKVEQLATWVGLGWNLNFGGAVTRTINGQADDEAIIGTPHYRKHYQTDVKDKRALYFEGIDENLDYEVGYVHDFKFNFEKEVLEQRMDISPDKYNFSVNGFSGEFFIDYENNIGVCLNNPSIKITPTFNDLSSTNYANKIIVAFTITDETGVIYEFNRPEKTISILEFEGGARTTNTYYSAWQLTKITSSSKKDILEFNYSITDVNWQQQVVYRDLSSVSTLITPDIDYNAPNIFSSVLKEKSAQSPTTNFINTTFNLESISLNNKEIIAINTKTEDRIDIPGGRNTLDFITIKDNNNDDVGKITFRTSYFSTNYPSSDNIMYRNRLRLDGVDFGTNAEKKYHFEYIGLEDTGEYNLPSRLSKDQDYWGYFNDAGNTTLIPASTRNDLQYSNFGGNRNTNPDVEIVGLGTLNKIVYPTGGYNVLNYQVHNLPQEFIPTPTEDYIQLLDNLVGDYSQTGEDPYNSSTCYDFGFNAYPISGQQLNYFGVEETGDYNVIIETTFIDPNDPNIRHNPTTFMAIFPENYTNNSNFCSLYGDTNIPFSQINPDGTYTIHLEQGVTYFGLFLSNHPGSTSSVYFDENINGLKQTTKYVGGLRINKIESYTDEGVKINAKKYIYDDISTSNLSTFNFEEHKLLSSAVLHTPENFTEIISQKIFSSSLSCSQGSNEIYYLDGKTVYYEKRNVNNLASQMDNHIAYSKVSEINILEDGKVNDVKVTKYYNDIYYLNQFIFNKSDENILNGSIKELSLYNDNGKIVSKNINNYNIVDNGLLPLDLKFNSTYSYQGSDWVFSYLDDNEAEKEKFAMLDPGVCGQIIVYGFKVYSPNEYFPTSIIPTEQILNSGQTVAKQDLLFHQRNSVLKKNDNTISYKYFYNSNNILTNTLETTTNYFYENPLHKQLTKTVATTNQNETLITKIDYAHDLLGSQPLMQNLIDANRISEPIQTKSFINNINNVLSHQLTKYTLTNDNLLLPEVIQTAKRDQALEDRIVYHKYDDKGNPLEVSKKDGQSICYIWGYNKSQPIAKIANATFSEINNYISSLQNLANLDDDRTVDVINGSNITYQGNEGNLREALQNLRAALPNAMVTTFTYDPLIGITSITDPKGQIQYFYYDNFNRLQYVKDKHGNILSESEYHYRPQN